MQRSGASVHIVVGFDFSPLSELALREAAALAAERPDITIHVVSARSDDSRHRISNSSSEDVGFELEQALMESARTALRDQGASEAIAVVPHTLVGEPADLIVAMAEDVDAELIIVGSHGRRGIKRLFLGSVAEEVMRSACCPVLVMRRTGQGVGGPECRPPWLPRDSRGDRRS